MNRRNYRTLTPSRPSSGEGLPYSQGRALLTSIVEMYFIHVFQIASLTHEGTGGLIELLSQPKTSFDNYLKTSVDNYQFNLIQTQLQVGFTPTPQTARNPTQDIKK